MLSSFLAWIVHTDYTFINVLTWINHILGIIMLVLYANQFVYIVLSIFVKPRRYKVAKTEHTYGYIICGRNEEKVIGNLIDSILKQDYPKEKMRLVKKTEEDMQKIDSLDCGMRVRFDPDKRFNAKYKIAFWGINVIYATRKKFVKMSKSMIGNLKFLIKYYLKQLVRSR